MVAKSLTKCFNIEEAKKVELPSIKPGELTLLANMVRSLIRISTAIEKAISYLDKDELPPHWELNRSLLLGEISTSSSSEEGVS